MGPQVIDKFYPWHMNGLWEPIPHGGMLSHHEPVGDGLGPALDEVTDSWRFPHGGPHLLWGANWEFGGGLGALEGAVEEGIKTKKKKNKRM